MEQTIYLLEFIAQLRTCITRVCAAEVEKVELLNKELLSVDTNKTKNPLIWMYKIYFQPECLLPSTLNEEVLFE